MNANLFHCPNELYSALSFFGKDIVDHTRCEPRSHWLMKFNETFVYDLFNNN